VSADEDRGAGVWCVYSLFRPAGTPCYVGEGLPNRPAQHLKLARSSSAFLYHQIRDTQSREGPIRVRTLYDGLAKWRACQLELALIREFGMEFGQRQLFNCKHNYGASAYGHQPLPEVVAEVRREKHLWRLPALTRIYVANDALLVAGLLSHATPQWTDEGWSLWIDATTLENLDAIEKPRRPSDDRSSAVLRLAEFMRLAKQKAK
jgi:hypothetical protein